MKKKTLVIGLSVLCICLLICTVGIICQKTTGKSDNLTKSTTTQPTEPNSKADEPSNSDCLQVIEKDGFTLEILGYEYVDKPEDYADYNRDYLWHEHQPIEGTDIHIKKETDYESVYKEAPELKAMDDGTANYTLEEGVAIIEKTQDIVDKYTYDVEVPYDYLFIRCRLINNENVERTNIGINDQTLAIIKDGIWDPENDHTLEMAYFDKSPVTCTNHEFFICNVGAEETLEYTCGFIIREDQSSGSYYFGNPDHIWNADGFPENPADQTMYMYHLMDR